MTTPLHFLHLEDDELDAELVQRMLKAGNLDCVVTCARNHHEFESALKKEKFDLIMSDYSIPAFNGCSALELARQQHPETPFIFLSGTIGEERAVESLKQGATDYVLKDRLARLVPAIRRALVEADALRERRRAEERIHYQAALLDKARDAICLNDMDQCILYWNKSAERLYGWTAQEALGRNANELLFQGDLSAPCAALRSLISKGEWLGELQQVTKDGKSIVVESRWTLLRDQRGEPRSMLIINTDVTEKKQIEAQFLRTQRLESIGALAGGIAHDLNNALTPVLMAAKLLRGEIATEDGRKLIDTMHSSARRGVEMVNQILSFARGVGGEHTVLQVAHLIHEMIKLARDTFPRSIQIQSHVPRDLSPVKGNATQLHQVLLNLCVNARDAMPDGGRLSIEAANVSLDEAAARARQQSPGPYVLITISDSGHGMPAEVLNKIFEPFFTTKPLGKGTGLGLSTVMGIVKTHDGFVVVSSEVDKGSTFRIFIPALHGAEAPPGHAPPEPPQGRGELILLVDDEISILEVTKAALEAFNYRVLLARDGTEAVTLYLRHKSEIHAVVTDMMMPRMNGPAAIHALKTIDPFVKIIGVSGLGPESPLALAGKSHVEAFLKKPFTTEELLNALHALLTR